MSNENMTITKQALFGAIKGEGQILTDVMNGIRGMNGEPLLQMAFMEILTDEIIRLDSILTDDQATSSDQMLAAVNQFGIAATIRRAAEEWSQ
jgi:hypothetical protein